MKRFKELDCRFCSKSFCCIKCRIKHEEAVHKINVDCPICLYGEMYVSNLTNDLIDHVREYHLPLHCLSCHIIFEEIDMIYCKCVATFVVTPKRVNTDDHDTPEQQTSSKISDNYFQFNIINNNIYTTSTPMPIDDKTKKEVLSDIISPLDYKESILMQSPSYSQVSPMTTVDRNLKKEVNTQRRVTFCELSTAESTRRSDALRDNETKQKLSVPTPILIHKSNYQEIKSSIKISGVSNIDVDLEDNSTAWQTALNFTFSDIDEVKSQTPNEEHKLMLDEPNTCRIENIEATDGLLHQDNNVSVYAACSADISKYENLSNDPIDAKLKPSHSFWSSMANAVRTVVQGIYGSKETIESGITITQIRSIQNIDEITSSSNKRTKPEDGYDSEDYPPVKKTRITCRRPIRPCLKYLPLQKITFDKATQTIISIPVKSHK